MMIGAWREPRNPGIAGVLLAAWLLWGIPGASWSSEPALEGPSPTEALTVAQYLDLQARAAGDDEAALGLGAYVAGLFAGLVHLNDRLETERTFCPPADFVPELRVLLNFIDAAAEPLRDDTAAAERLGLDALLLDALSDQLPCD